MVIIRTRSEHGLVLERTILRTGRSVGEGERSRPSNTPLDEITRIATTLRDDWKVEWIAPTHCTGEPAFAILKASFGDHYLYAGLGTTVELGPKVTTKAEAGQQRMHAMDLEDVIDYRVALAHQMLDALADGRMRLAQAPQ